MKTSLTCAFSFWLLTLAVVAEPVAKIRRLQTVEGQTFENVEVTAVLENSIRFTHEHGAGTLKFSSLPPDVAKSLRPKTTEEREPPTAALPNPPVPKTEANEASAHAQPNAINAQDPKAGEENLKGLLAKLKANQTQRLLTQDEVQTVVTLLRAISAIPALRPDGTVSAPKGFPDSEAIAAAKAYSWAVPYRSQLCEIVDVELQHIAAAVAEQNAAAAAVPQAANEVAVLVQVLRGASIVAQDGRNTFLGKIDSEIAVNSIFNTVSLYGSEIGVHSVFNKIGQYGSDIGLYSANNEFSTKPPMIVKNGKILGYLTANRFVRGGISLLSLLALKKEF